MNRNDMKRIVYFLVSLLGFTKLAAQDIADKLNISRNTVSKALNNTGKNYPQLCFALPKAKSRNICPEFHKIPCFGMNISLNPMVCHL